MKINLSNHDPARLEPAALSIINKIAEQVPCFAILITGASGTGKSHLAEYLAMTTSSESNIYSLTLTNKKIRSWKDSVMRFCTTCGYDMTTSTSSHKTVVIHNIEHAHAPTLNELIKAYSDKVLFVLTSTGKLDASTIDLCYPVELSTSQRKLTMREW